jgi:hypothetical protein
MDLRFGSLGSSTNCWCLCATKHKLIGTEQKFGLTFQILHHGQWPKTSEKSSATVPEKPRILNLHFRSCVYRVTRIRDQRNIKKRSKDQINTQVCQRIRLPQPESSRLTTGCNHLAQSMVIGQHAIRHIYETFDVR